MRTIVCTRLEYVFASEVHYLLLPNIILLRAGCAFRSVVCEKPPQYRQAVSETPSGNLSEETISLSIAYSADLPLFQHVHERYVLKVHTSTGWFLMGTPDNPATFTFEQDLRVADGTFICKKPLL
jgi:hypothetical protein